MENKEYKLGSASSQKEAGPPALGQGGTEKSKDFIGTWAKLIAYCKKYIAVVVIALICAIVGTVLTLIGPDKLSDLTIMLTQPKSGMIYAITISFLTAQRLVLTDALQH